VARHLAIAGEGIKNRWAGAEARALDDQFERLRATASELRDPF
jgi:hypothetical protein